MPFCVMSSSTHSGEVESGYLCKCKDCVFCKANVNINTPNGIITFRYMIIHKINIDSYLIMFFH